MTEQTTGATPEPLKFGSLVIQDGRDGDVCFELDDALFYVSRENVPRLIEWLNAFVAANP